MAMAMAVTCGDDDGDSADGRIVCGDRIETMTPLVMAILSMVMIPMAMAMAMAMRCFCCR